ncbi:phosphoadenosine phosphosulfate reductase family protein [Paenibacillus sp. FSL P4-0176]|uniref:phosphoadenosine phosphosulfate reductase domain-containing protein n=1 Tax=Paenibacillus sp. FSL P4-0176 TaxID=2921631 RepID=UPI0030D5CD22
MDDYKMKSTAAIAAILSAYTDESEPGAWVAAYSGGKDSTVAFDLLVKAMLMLKRNNPALLTRTVYLTTANTGLDFVTDPLKQSELAKIKTLVEREGLPIEIVEVQSTNENSFMFLTIGKGYPLPKSRMSRWCTGRLKIEPSQKAHKDIAPVLTLTGVRLSESAERRRNIEARQESEYRSNTELMPIVNFTLDDVWSYLVREGMAWGDAEELGQLYKDATGECGLRQRKAGADEKTDDPCGARTGCIICPVVKIDKSSQEFAKSHPWLQPYVDLRNLMIEMYKDPRNKAGRMRSGKVLEYGQGTFTIKARMALYEAVRQAEFDNEELAIRYGAKPQKLIYSNELDELIQQQWQTDLDEYPWLEDADEIGLFYETKIKGLANGYQLVWNIYHDMTT